MTKRLMFILVCAVLALAGLAQAQTSPTGTTTLGVTVGAEAAISVTSATTLTTSSTSFASPYTGSTAVTYYIRTGKTSGTGTLTLKVTTDFTGTGGPSVATPPTAGDALTYTATVSSPGTAATGTQTASMAAATAFGTWGAAASSAKAGNAASVAWSLTDDPAYAAGGPYNATVTFTISAT